jgi:hypothetical protein
LDRITANKIKGEKKYTQLVDKTWKKALKKANITHKDWLKHREVFSG